VTEPQLHAGRAVWDRLRQPDPSGLAALARGGIPELPFMARAVQRHCQELPWVGDGLSLTERLVLELVAEQSRTVGEVFRDLVMEREPLVWLGDLGVRGVVECDAGRQPAAIHRCLRRRRIDVWYRERLAITDAGRAVLAGGVDWLSLSPPERWVGGVRIVAGSPCWRWDQSRATVALK